MKKSFFIVIATFIGSIIFVNLCLSDPKYDDLNKKAENYIFSNRPKDAETCYFNLAQKDFKNIDNHYRLVETHYSIPKEEKVGKNNYIYRDDTTIKAYYTNLTYYNDSILHDIGYYCLGLCCINEKDYNTGLIYYDSVLNRQQKYLNNSIGFVLLEIGDEKRAETYFRNEIKNKGAVSNAYSNLSRLLLKNKNLTELNTMINDKKLNHYLSSQTIRVTYFLQLKVLSYWRLITTRFISNINLPGFISAFLILIIWLVYLRQIDVYEKERWVYIIITAILGMSCTFLTFLMTDFLNQFIGFDLNGDVGNDFIYSIVGIGMIEEAVKIIPLFVLLALTSQVNEPIDYIIYASVSALGFAFVENLLYFNESSLFSIQGRALSSVVSHMFDSSIIAYGLIVAKFKYKRDSWFFILFSYIIASISHGFYDFWLINDEVSHYSFFTTFILIFGFIWYTIFIGNAINNSTFFDEKKVIEANRLNNFLFYSLSFIILLEYFILSFKFGPSAGNHQLSNSIFSGAYLIFVLSTRLSNFTIARHEWKPLFQWIISKEE
jgi:RsiW-degrading membrane proteinase PrsW (M82 family)